MIRMIFRFFGEAVNGLIQARLMTIVSVGTITAALIFAIGVSVAWFTVSSWVTQLSSGVHAVVFAADTTNDPLALAQLANTIRKDPAVSITAIIDKEEAKNRFIKAYGTSMLNAVSDNPLPASIEITLKRSHQHIDSMQSFVTRAGAIGGVDGATFSRDWADGVRKIQSILATGGSIAVILMSIALIFMITNTVKLTIYARKELIANMRSVGATAAYIKAPFIIEGMLQGLIGALAALSVCGAIQLASTSLPLVWGSWRLVALCTISTGVLIGCLGSISAVRKFL